MSTSAYQLINNCVISVEFKNVFGSVIDADLLELEFVKPYVVVPQIDVVFIILVADLTRERPLSGVDPHVPRQMVLHGKGAAADGADVRLIAGVSPIVKYKVTLRRELLVADAAGVRPLAGVQ